MSAQLLMRRGIMAKPPFNPLSLSPSAWYKPETLSALNDSDPVGSWLDSSGNGRTLSSTSTAQPLFRAAAQNGLSVVDFDGINDQLSLAGFPYAVSLTVIAVISFDAAPGSSSVWSSDNFGTIEMRAQTTGANITHGIYSASASISTPAVAVPSYHVVTGRFNPSVYLNVRLDGGSGSFPATANNLSGTRALCLGSRGGGVASSARIGEYFAWTGAAPLSDSDAAKIEGYLKARWATP